MKYLFILMLLLAPIYGEENASVIKQKLISGKIKPSEVTGNKKDFKLCFKCKACKDKTFQRFYIRFIAAQKLIQTTKKKDK